jgi:hypothetical protein
MVVVPTPWLVGTGFGDAEIVAADDAGVAGGACASGAFEALHPAKKNSGKRIAAKMNCFIKMVGFSSFSNRHFGQILR